MYVICKEITGLKLARLIPIVLASCLAAGSAFAAAGIAFSISGVDPVNVMRFPSAEGKGIRIGYIQSTSFSHTDPADPKDEIEAGILYYSVIFERIDDRSYQMEVSYDFASPDGFSRGIRNRSIVTQEILSGVSAKEIREKARQHAHAMTKVMYDNFFKEKMNEEDRKGLERFLEDLNRDLLKSLPKDGVMIIRRWDDLTAAPR